jgi:hypothetical protein
MYLLLGTLAVGIVICVVLILRSHNPGWQVLPALGWIGGLLVIGGFFLLPWISIGPPGTVERNAAWIASKTEVIDAIKRLPGFESWLASVNAPTGADIIAILEHPIQNTFLDYARTGRLINAYHYMDLVRRVNPLVVLVMAGGLLSALAGVVFSLRRLIFSRYDAQSAFQIFASMAALSFLFLLSVFTTFDTLGSVDDFKLRLMAALAEAHMSTGVWCVLLGLALVAISGIADLIHSLAPWQNVTLDSEYLNDYS